MSGHKHGLKSQYRYKYWLECFGIVIDNISCSAISARHICNISIVMVIPESYGLISVEDINIGRGNTSNLATKDNNLGVEKGKAIMEEIDIKENNTKQLLGK